MFGKICRLAYGLENVHWVHIVSVSLAVCSFNTSNKKSPVIIVSDISISTASATEFSVSVKYSVSELGDRYKIPVAVSRFKPNALNITWFEIFMAFVANSFFNVYHDTSHDCPLVGPFVQVYSVIQKEGQLGLRKVLAMFL